MNLADFTSAGLILPYLRSEDAASAIQALSHVLQQENRIPDMLPFYQAALNREYMAGTEIEAGMAFPHARMPGLKDVAFALGRCPEPMAWGPRGVRSVRLVFLLAVPATDATQYLLLISGLVRMARNQELLQKLQNAEDPFLIYELLKQVELRSVGQPAGMKREGIRGEDQELSAKRLS